MEGYLAFLLLKPGPADPNNKMDRKLFRTEAECRRWIATQPIPSYAWAWWIEEFNVNGDIASSQSVKSSHERPPT